MKIALIGYGKMGHEIERIALERGHEIACIIDITNLEDFNSESFRSAQVAIEFTRPESAMFNYRKCFDAKIPIVSGTTGWLDNLEEVKSECEKGRTFFYASNFSLGVNLFSAINIQLAKMMNAFPVYDVKMKEIHHTHKLDAPSGTAITLAEGILDNIDRKSKWVNELTKENEALSIISERIGQVPGYHEIVWESDVDTISIAHNAKSRVGFALGAVLAAEFSINNTGFLGMNNLLGF